MEANLDFGRWDFGTAWHRGFVPYGQSRPWGASLPAEFLLGPHLGANLLNLGM
jgi:hypothetical protein